VEEALPIRKRCTKKKKKNHKEMQARELWGEGIAGGFCIEKQYGEGRPRARRGLKSETSSGKSAEGIGIRAYEGWVRSRMGRKKKNDTLKSLLYWGGGVTLQAISVPKKEGDR